jgi:hypothetical protein
VNFSGIHKPFDSATYSNTRSGLYFHKKFSEKSELSEVHSRVIGKLITFKFACVFKKPINTTEVILHLAYLEDEEITIPKGAGTYFGHRSKYVERMGERDA